MTAGEGMGDKVRFVMVTGGGAYKSSGGAICTHGHVGFDLKNNTSLVSFYVSLLQRCGIEVEKLGTSSGRPTGLELGS